MCRGNRKKADEKSWIKRRTGSLSERVLCELPSNSELSCARSWRKWRQRMCAAWRTEVGQHTGLWACFKGWPSKQGGLSNTITYLKADDRPNAESQGASHFHQRCLMIRCAFNWALQRREMVTSNSWQCWGRKIVNIVASSIHLSIMM